MESFISILFLMGVAVTLQHKASSAAEVCPSNSPKLNLLDYKCCNVLIDAINSEIKQKDCLRKEYAELQKQLGGTKTQPVQPPTRPPRPPTRPPRPPVRATPPPPTKKCDEYLMIGSAKKTGKFTASSQFHRAYGPNRAYLYTRHGKRGSGGWSAGFKDRKMYLQIDLGSSRKIVGVVTQGRNRHRRTLQWVTKYRVLYSTNCKTWKYIGGRRAQIFNGNKDTESIKKNLFRSPVTARCIRINPMKWKGHASMRADVIGC